jgi:hypothetical protein
MTASWVRRARRGVGRAARLARTALDRVEPVLDRLRIEPPTRWRPETCAACPLCALMAALRGSVPSSCSGWPSTLAGSSRCCVRLWTNPPSPAAERTGVGQPEGRAADTGRRPRRWWAVTLTVGVDVGGTSVRAGVVNGDGTVLDTARTPTPPSEARWRRPSRVS